MPKLLSAPQHHDRIQCSSENLVLYKQSPTKFLASIVTCDESWVYHFDPLSQQEAKEWTKKGEYSGARLRQQQSAGKVLLSVFWDEKGVLLTDYLEKGHTVTGLYYVNLIEKLRQAIKNKRRGKLSSGVHLLHDNAPSHTSHVAVTAIHAAGFKTLNHSPYSPDLAPSDYHLFSHLKRYLRGKVFKTDAVFLWRAILSRNQFLSILVQLVHCQSAGSVQLTCMGHTLNNCQQMFFESFLS